MFMIGRDTTAQALSWTFFMLSQNPRALESLLDEIDETLGDSQSPTYDQVKGMKYAKAVFHETLRLYPSVPSNMKTANRDDILPDGTFVPKDTIVSWNLYAMGRTAAIWGDDAKEFKPERWLSMEKQPNSFDYPVFNAGPRTCLGKSMAELEGVYVIVSLLRRFRFDVLEPEKVTYANSLTLPMKNGLKVRVSLRE
jgi:cytochrome P450